MTTTRRVPRVRTDPRVQEHGRRTGAWARVSPRNVARAVFPDGHDIDGALSRLSVAGFPRTTTTVDDAHDMDFQVLDQQIREDLHRSGRWAAIGSITMGSVAALVVALVLASATDISWELPLGVLLGGIAGGLAMGLAGLIPSDSGPTRDEHAAGGVVVTVITVRAAHARDILQAAGGVLVVPE